MELTIEMGKKHTDLSFIRENSFNNNEFIVEMIMLFLTTTPIMLEEIHTQAAKHDWEKLSQAAHKLKAQVQTFGVNEAYTLLDKIETACANAQDETAIKEMVDKARSICHTAMTELRADLDTIKGN